MWRCKLVGGGGGGDGGGKAAPVKGQVAAMVCHRVPAEKGGPSGARTGRCAPSCWSVQGRECPPLALVWQKEGRLWVMLSARPLVAVEAMVPLALPRFLFVLSLRLLLLLMLLLLGCFARRPLEQLTFGMADCVHLGGCTCEAFPVRSSGSAAAV